MAISLWQNNTCLIFNELTQITPTTNPSYILFQRDDQYGCSSSVGYDPTDPTSVILISATCGVVSNRFFLMNRRVEQVFKIIWINSVYRLLVQLYMKLVTHLVLFIHSRELIVIIMYQ